jgi:apolipoprotein N-acyltransferase
VTAAARLGNAAAAGGAALTVAALASAPWLDERLGWASWVAGALALGLVTGRRGWRDELLVLGTTMAAIVIAFHWAPSAMASAMRSGSATGFAFALPIILFDACRAALPFWVVGRTVNDPRAAWLPAAAVAVVTEALAPAVFPWKFGYAQAAWPVTMQVAGLVGPEGPTFTLFAHAGSLLVAAWWLAGTMPRRVPAAGLAAVAVSLVSLAYGWWAMAAEARRVAAAPSVRVALVQADPEAADGIDRLRRLTRATCAASASRRPDLACWPECCGGSYEIGLDSLADEATVHRRSRPPLQGLRPLADPDCPLLFGASVYRGYPERPSDLYQAALLVDGDERIVGAYHKRHLMPFGEYVPFGDLFPDLRLYFPMTAEFDVGGTPDVLRSGPARLGVMLCYEDMVPEAAASLVRAGANLLVSLVNGSVFTQPLTLAQHRLLAQGRAVELGRVLVRASATGETCVISSVGVVTHRLPPGPPGVLVADVPLLEGLTLAARIGPVFPVACGLGLGAVVLRRRFLRRG